MLSEAEVSAAVAVKDVEAAKGWYDKTLGLTLEREAPDGVTYRCGGGTTLFVYPSSFAGHGPEHGGGVARAGPRAGDGGAPLARGSRSRSTTSRA